MITSIIQTRHYGKSANLFSLIKSGNSNERIILVENDQIQSDNLTISNTFNSFFTNVISTLNIQFWQNSESHLSSDTIYNAINWYSNHPSILKIKSSVKQDAIKFNFHLITKDDITETIQSLNSKKKTSGNIPTHILKTFESVYNESLTDCINNCISKSEFPDFLKLADVTPCFKKGDPTDKSNYRPISILPAISKVYEKIIFKQILAFIEPKLNSLLCGFRKKYSTQHALFLLLKKWQECKDKGGITGSLLYGPL